MSMDRAHAIGADALSLQRRDLMKLAGSGLALAIGTAGHVSGLAAQEAPKKFGAQSMPGGVVENPLVFVSIAADGQVTIVAHRVEMGTGIRTSLPMVVADELEADWARVKVVQAPADEARYGSQNVDGSRSVRHFMLPMRRVGAAARQMLEAAAAQRWGASTAEVRAVKHEVLHLPTGRRLGYGELADAAMKQPVPAVTALKLKAPKDFRYIGRGRVMPVDGRDIATGRAQYGIDVRLPGMLYAVMARPPVYGGKLKRVDAADALKLPGVLEVIEIPGIAGPPGFNPVGGVAVVARNTWAALQGRDALKIEWDDGANAGYDSVDFKAQLRSAAAAAGKTVRNDGDAPGVLESTPAARRLEAEYYVPHLAHASMETPVATARFAEGRCDCWAPVQAPQGALDTIAKLVGMPPAQVTVTPTLLGGGFGRKSMPDFAAEAALVSKAMDGAPVKLQWTREDDLQHDYFHTVSVERLQGAFGADGKLSAWLHRSVSPTILSTFVPGAKGQADFETGMTAINVPWVARHVQLEVGEVTAHTRIGWFRSVANIPHAFAVQSFVAELAHHAGRDPRDYLLELIGPARRINPTALSDTWNYTEDPAVYVVDTGRLRRVIEEATKRAGWGRKLGKGRGQGLAVAYTFMTYVAAVVEVHVNDKGELEVPRVDVAIDCGPQVNPERIRAQVEGGCVMGLGLAMMGEISFKQGRVEQTNFHDYLVPRNHEAPRQIRTWMVGADDFSIPPGGVGEPPVPPMAPALCNAIFAASGRRIRNLPIRDQLVGKT